LPAAAAAVIFAKFPQAGQVKTRLIGSVSAQTAAALHAICLQHVIEIAAGIEGLDVIVATTPPDADFSDFLLPGVRTIDQGTGDLGQRLAVVTSKVFELGYHDVILLGSDCATLTRHDLRTGMAALRHAAVVIGPAQDGGYYLLGMTRYEQRLFDRIDWSTERVCDQTIERVGEAGMKYELLRIQRDLDDAADLRALLQADAGDDDEIVRATREKILKRVTESWNDE